MTKPGPEGNRIWEEVGSKLKEAVFHLTKRDVRNKEFDPARVRKVIRGQRESGKINEEEATQMEGHLTSILPKKRKGRRK